MNNNSLEKYEGGFFQRLKRLVRNIFMKEQKTVVGNTVYKKNNEQKLNPIENMKTESQKTAIKEDILSLIDKKPDILKTLSLEKLKEIDKLYDEKIEKNVKEIEYLSIKLKGYERKFA